VRSTSTPRQAARDARRELARSIYAAHRDVWSIDEAMAFADALIVDRYLEVKSAGCCSSILLWLRACASCPNPERGTWNPYGSSSFDREAPALAISPLPFAFS